MSKCSVCEEIYDDFYVNTCNACNAIVCNSISCSKEAPSGHVYCADCVMEYMQDVIDGEDCEKEVNTSMGLQEAIDHCRHDGVARCSGCQAEHNQLADWLEELQEYRNVGRE